MRSCLLRISDTLQRLAAVADSASLGPTSVWQSHDSLSVDLISRRDGKGCIFDLISRWGGCICVAMVLIHGLGCVMVYSTIRLLRSASPVVPHGVGHYCVVVCNSLLVVYL
eukprot:jgi/Ulvmu1/4615/UM002_0344.1